MLTPIILLTSIGFAAWYPLCFWLSRQDPLKDHFARFHMGLPAFIAGVLSVWVAVMPLANFAQWSVWIWAASLLGVTARDWHRETPALIPVSLTAVIGLLAAVLTLGEFTPLSLPSVLSFLLGTAVIAAAAYAMNLGHWYLNVHGLPIAHLITATKVFWWLVGLRAGFDLIGLAAGSVTMDWQSVPLWRFLWSLEGFGLFIGIFFGTLFPLVASFFVMGTLKVKSTQSATGILYVILCAVLIGEIAYRYYLLKYGIGL